METAAAYPDPLRHALGRLAAGDSLTESESRAAIGVVMGGFATPATIGALLLGMRSRGESAAEVAGTAGALRDTMLRVELPERDRLVDTCGTGGGLIRTLNISTAAAFVAAGAGVPIAKHGNRSFSSKSGSADVLEALGVAIDIEPAVVPGVMAAAGISFLYAPTYHPAMRHVGAVRRELGVATVMNLAGPLANPAGVGRQVLGVADRCAGKMMAEALGDLGAQAAMVVHARIGIDEIAPVGETEVWELAGGEIREWLLDPADFGLATSGMVGTEGGEPAENAAAIEGLFRAPADAAPALVSAVLLNAAAAIRVGTDGVDLAEAIAIARRSLEEGAALERLQRLRLASPFRTS
jgi:anthranilate phosphoribosyltransferase